MERTMIDEARRSTILTDALAAADSIIERASKSDQERIELEITFANLVMQKAMYYLHRLWSGESLPHSPRNTT